jgi:cytidylate kinase
MRDTSTPVVTISSTYGAGGTVVGPAVAQRLRLPYLDRILSSDVAQRAATDAADAVAEARLTEDERSEGLLRRVLDSLASVPAVFGSMIPPLDDPALVEQPVWERVEAEIARMAGDTGGVIVGRGAACVLREHPGAVHVRLDGPRSARLAQAMRIEGIDEAEARRRQAAIDRTRALYVKRFYDVDATDPRLYHLMLDTTALPLDVCTDVVVTVATARWQAMGVRAP